MRAIHLSVLSLIPFLGSIAACGVTTAPPGDTDEAEEVWDSANNPAFVDNTFVYEIASLPAEGVSGKPLIPADYWPTAKDSVNVRWDGDELSPAEKVEKAFARDGAALAMSTKYGIRAQTSRTECTEAGNECKDMKDGSSCSIPRGETKGRCIPSWWGICHGWAPYAITEPAAMKPVTRNGVTFFPGDLEALMSLAYSEGLPTNFISQRCNKETPANDDSGRVTDGECRDMNPGSMFVVVSNMLGLRKTALVEDRTWNDQVWNQPVQGYKVTNATTDGKLKEISKADAVSALGTDVTFTELMAKTTLKKGERKTGVFKATAAGELIFRLSGTHDADLYLKKGAEATEAANDCKSAGGSADEKCKITVAVGDEVNYLILGFAEESELKLSLGTHTVNAEYTFNANAKRFYYVEMNLDYITEARPARESHATASGITEHTRTDSLKFILEIDAQDRIMGGEWVDESRTHHPDFMWWPKGKPTGSRAGVLTYDDVKKLNDEASASIAPVAPETRELLKDALLGSSSQFATVGLKGGEKLTVTMTGAGGNADLHVRLGKKPTTARFDCKSTGPEATETCEVTAPAAGGTYFVRASGVSGNPTVTVVGKITPAS